MMAKYDEWTQPIMGELNKKFKYFTKLGEDRWLVQSNKKSLMEAYFVDVLNNGHIIMSGDYDGVMVRPGCPHNQLITWMAGASALSYFAEKVTSANRHHQCKEYSEKKAEKNLDEIKRDILEDLENLEDDEISQRETKFNEVLKYASIDFEHEILPRLKIVGICK